MGTLLTSCEEEPIVAGEVPSVTFQFISKLIVHKSISLLVTEVINEIYKGEYGEPTMNPLAKMELNMGDDQGSHQGDHNVQH